ncbi:MAG: Hpt domain-containing protein [Planctomycetota bacterium]
MESESSSLVSFDRTHSPDHGGEQVIDADVFSILEELADDDDPGLVAELVELFLVDSAERMASIATALESSDVDTIRAAAHALKSSSANIGAMPFSQACANLEAAARSGESEKALGFAKSALAMYDDVRSAFSAGTEGNE